MQLLFSKEVLIFLYNFSLLFIAPSASITGPAIIGKDAEVRHCAFIRGNAIVGEGAVVGNSTELKKMLPAGTYPLTMESG